MIIFKYINKQLLVTLLVIAFVLVLVLLTSRLVRYINDVASGEIAFGFLFNLIAYRLPDILLMVLPISLLLAILLVLGRMYIDNEMSVFFSTGIGIRKLSLYIAASITLITLVVATLSLFLAPLGLRKVDELFIQNSNRTVFDSIRAGRFSELGKSGLSLYTETLTDDREVMSEVFIAKDDSPQKPGYQIVAEQGHLEVDAKTRSKYLVLEHGFRYEGKPGHQDYRVTQFDTFGIKLAEPPKEVKTKSVRGMPTADLFSPHDSSEMAELQWRISLPLLVPIISILGIPLSRVNPRQGRFYFLIPAMVFYFTYLILLSNMKTAVEQNTINPWLGLWWVHLLFLGLGGLVLSNIHRKVFNPFKRKIQRQN